MRRFTVREPLTFKGRTRKGIRGFAGKPLHPPLTDFPIAAYVIAAVLDVISFSVYTHHEAVSLQMFHAATWVMIGGAVVSLFAAATGIADWASSTTAGTQVRRTANTHGLIMITVTVLILLDLALRLTSLHRRDFTPGGLAVLSVVAALLVTVGATFGGSLVFEHGFNVENATDSPAWAPSETDTQP